MATVASNVFGFGSWLARSPFQFRLRTDDLRIVGSYAAWSTLLGVIAMRFLSYTSDPLTAQQVRAALTMEPRPVRVIAIGLLRGDPDIVRDGEPITRKLMDDAISEGRFEVEGGELTREMRRLSARNLATLDAVARDIGDGK